VRIHKFMVIRTTRIQVDYNVFLEPKLYYAITPSMLGHFMMGLIVSPYLDYSHSGIEN
jgi:hypothetical protein